MNIKHVLYYLNIIFVSLIKLRNRHNIVKKCQRFMGPLK